MNIAILASGGDGAGMNNCLYDLVKKLTGHKNIRKINWEKHNIDFLTTKINATKIPIYAGNNIACFYAH